MLSGFTQVDILEVNYFGWMKYGVLLEIVSYLNVVMMVGEILTVHVSKMLILHAMEEVCYTQVHNLLSIQGFTWDCIAIFSWPLFCFIISNSSIIICSVAA